MSTPAAPDHHLEGRVRATERELAVLGSQVKDLGNDVRELMPLVVATTELRGAITGLRNDVGTVKREVGEVKQALDARDRTATEERKAVKVALIGLTATILAAVIGGSVTLLIAGLPS